MLLMDQVKHTKHRQRSKDPKNIAAALFLNRNWLHRSPRSSGDHSSLKPACRSQKYIRLRLPKGIQPGRLKALQLFYEFTGSPVSHWAQQRRCSQLVSHQIAEGQLAQA